MIGEQFFYWYGVLAAVVTVVLSIPLLFAVPAVVTALVGSGVLKLLLWWDEWWLEYDDGKNRHETIQNKTEVYTAARDDGRWEYHVSHTLNVIYKAFKKSTEWYIEVVDEYVWKKLPLVLR